MSLFQIAVYSVLQGLVDFLPLPAEAHFIILSDLLGWARPGADLLIAMQAGALAAIVCFYLADLVKIAFYMADALVQRRIGPVARIGFCLVAATIPVAVAWFVIYKLAGLPTASAHIAGWASLAGGLALLFSSYVNRHLVWQNIIKVEGERRDTLRHLSVQQSIMVGLAQALMLVPGVSRPAMVLSAGLFLGLRPEGAARLSFLLAIPVILFSACMEATNWNGISSATAAAWPDLLVAAVIAFATSLAALYFFIRYVSKLSDMKAFVAILFATSAVLLTLFD